MSSICLVPEHRGEFHVLQLDQTWQRLFGFLQSRELVKVRNQKWEDKSAHFVDVQKQLLCAFDVTSGIVCDLLQIWKTLQILVESSKWMVPIVGSLTMVSNYWHFKILRNLITYSILFPMEMTNFEKHNYLFNIPYGNDNSFTVIANYTIKLYRSSWEKKNRINNFKMRLWQCYLLKIMVLAWCLLTFVLFFQLAPIR